MISPSSSCPTSSINSNTYPVSSSSASSPIPSSSHLDPESRSHKGSYEAVLEYFTSNSLPLPSYLQTYDSFVSHFFTSTDNPSLLSPINIPPHLTSYEAFIRYSIAKAAPAASSLPSTVPLPLNQFCPRCTKALASSPPPPSHAAWWRRGGELCTPEELFRSASEGQCQFCWFVMVKVLRRLVVGVQIEDEEDLKQKVEEVWRDVKYLLVGLSFWAEDRREDVWRGEVSVRCVPRVPLGREKDVDVDMEGKVVVSEFVRLRRGYIPGPSYPPSFLASFHTASEQSWSQALEWINNCRSHALCSAAETMDCHERRPARLIAVGRPGETHVRVIETAGLAVSETPFMSLSHCWGKDGVPTQLLKGNYDRFTKEGIRLTELPKTFRDAIEVTQRLNIVPYIWIDSLCIIQDSKEDWDDESVKMQYVYRNSVLNLAAGASPNSHGGLFNPRHPLSTVPWSIEVPLSDDNDDKDYNIKNKTFLTSEYRSEKESDLILFTRGWVLQEQLLARRTLIFGKEELHWECVTCEASESFPSSIDRERWDGDMNDRRTIFQHQWENLTGTDTGNKLGPADSSDMNSKRRKAWELLVQTYFSRSLTKASDRLIAISGIAEQLSGRWGPGVTYLAGLWSYRLVQGLLWYMGGEDRCEERDAQAAPSWSWASLVPEHVPGVTDLKLAFAEAECVDGLAEVLEAQVTPVRSTNPFGPVVPGSGSIRLRGPVLPRPRIRNRDGNCEVYDLVFGANEMSSDFRMSESGVYVNMATGMPAYLQSYQSIAVRWDNINDMKEDEEEAYLAPLQVQLIEDGPAGNPSKLQLVGLVLLKASSWVAVPQFRRVGLFFITDEAPQWNSAPDNELQDGEQRDNETATHMNVDFESSSDPESCAVRYPDPNYHHHPPDTDDDSSNSQPDDICSEDSYSSNPFADATWESESGEETERDPAEFNEYYYEDFSVWASGIERLKNQGVLRNIDTWFAQEIQQGQRSDRLKEDPYANGPRPLNTNLATRYSPCLQRTFYHRIDRFLETCQAVARLKPDLVLGGGDANGYYVYEIV
ncbi:protein TOL [Neurospora crassa]|uniref:TOL n=2 Tax=Neurospora crassa TaxID=5141 RepID=Q7RWB3_NEUCR|nr:TOL [Neurospora crassa OR74A]EAA26675.2 TOL [Neurospora crassa OR74A]KHE88607.1 protein TOL [Neurospora crassa]CAF05993.1 protein TOL [Neurospora crassa]|eukprot:XP_955911.2 TOL [Neurospora crassa OR74A]